jgi:hypothetical protein
MRIRDPEFFCTPDLESGMEKSNTAYALDEACLTGDNDTAKSRFIGVSKTSGVSNRNKVCPQMW